jgi:hypothetical protein
LDDGRVHDESENTGKCGSIPKAGVRESVPIFQFSRLFYTDTGKLLNIGDTSSNEKRPVLLIKRDINAAPRPTDEGAAGELLATPVIHRIEGDDQTDIDKQLTEECDMSSRADKEPKYSADRARTNLPQTLDPEWLAFEVCEDSTMEEDDGSDSESSESDTDSTPRRTRALDVKHRAPSMDPGVIDQLRCLSLHAKTSPGSPSPSKLSTHMAHLGDRETQDFVTRSPFGAVTTSLSLLEMLIRLAGLQEFQQASHLSIPDHVLTYFLEETSTTGLLGEDRRKARDAAKQRVGFDPYQDSP